MAAEETSITSTQLSDEDIHCVVVSLGPLEEGQIVNLTMTEAAASSATETWLKTLPTGSLVAAKPLSWAKKNDLVLDTEAEPDAFR